MPACELADPVDSNVCNRPRLRWRASAHLLLGILITGNAGCGYTGGKILYMLGFGRVELIKAEFDLTSGPVLILVDDFDERVGWPAAKRYVAEELEQHLLKSKSVKKTVPQQTLIQLRQSDPGFGKRGCREVGELAGAEQVLWLVVDDFLADEGITDPSSAAYFGVYIKVINVNETEQRSRVRLWPPSPRGYYVAVQLGGDQVVRLGERDAISRTLATKLAFEITKLFHDHRPDEFGSGP